MGRGLRIGHSAGGGGGGSSNLVHGETFTVPGGAVYGSRSVIADIFDDASGASIASKWNTLTGNRIDYSTPAAFMAGSPIALPHSKVSKFIGIKHRPGGYYDYNNWLAHTVSVVKPYKVYAAAYRRTNPNWIFGTGDAINGGDNNYKQFNIATGGEPFAGNYWYQDHTGQKSSLASSWGESFYSSGTLGNLTLQSATTGGSGDTANDNWYNWVKHEYLIVGDPSNGVIKFAVNEVQKYAATGQNSDNAADGNRTFCIGHYGRTKLDNTTDIDDTSGREMALADVVMVIGADAFKRVVLANSATWASATIREYQPIVSWSGTVTAQCNQGKIPDGTAHLYIFDADDNRTYLGTVTVGALSHGAAFTVTGSGFGSRTATDYFLGGSGGVIESLATNAEPTDTSVFKYQAGDAAFAAKLGYTDSVRGKVLKSEYGGATGYNGGISANVGTLAPGTKVYVSVWLYGEMTRPGGATVWDHQWKILRFRDVDSVVDGPTNIYINDFGGDGVLVENPGGSGFALYSGPGAHFGTGLSARNAWFRIEFQYALASAQGVADGVWTTRISRPSAVPAAYDLYTNSAPARSDDILTYADATRYAWIIFQNYWGNFGAVEGQAPTPVGWRQDDHYIAIGADAFKRVELCNSATYSSSTLREIQPITSWSGTSVSGTLNKGGLSAGSYWLHVVDGTTSLGSLAVTVA